MRIIVGSVVLSVALASAARAQSASAIESLRGDLERQIESLLDHVDTKARHQEALVVTYPSCAHVARRQIYLAVVRALSRAGEIATLAESGTERALDEVIEEISRSEFAPVFGRVPEAATRAIGLHARAVRADASARAAVWTRAWETLAALAGERTISGTPPAALLGAVQAAHSGFANAAHAPPHQTFRIWSGPVRENTIWRGTVLVEGEVHVHPRCTLTVLPGTHVLFRPLPTVPKGTSTAERSSVYTNLWVEGRLVAEGIPGHRILWAPYTKSLRHSFVQDTVDEATTKAGRRAQDTKEVWHGMWLYSGPKVRASELRYCHFTHMSSRLGRNAEPPSFISWHRAPRMVKDVGIVGGICIHWSAPRVRHCWIEQTQTTCIAMTNVGPGAAGGNDETAQPVITDNVFWSWRGRQGVLFMNSHPAEFARNVMISRPGFSKKVFDLFHSGKGLSFHRNVFATLVPAAKEPPKGRGAFLSTQIYGATPRPRSLLSNIFVGHPAVQYLWDGDASKKNRSAARKAKRHLKWLLPFADNLLDDVHIHPWRNQDPNAKIQRDCEKVFRKQNKFGRAEFVAENFSSPWLGDWRLTPRSPGVKGKKALVGIAEAPARPNAVAK